MLECRSSQLGQFPLCQMASPPGLFLYVLFSSRLKRLVRKEFRDSGQVGGGGNFLEDVLQLYNQLSGYKLQVVSEDCSETILCFLEVLLENVLDVGPVLLGGQAPHPDSESSWSEIVLEAGGKKCGLSLKINIS